MPRSPHSLAHSSWNGHRHCGILSTQVQIAQVTPALFSASYLTRFGDEAIRGVVPLGARVRIQSCYPRRWPVRATWVSLSAPVEPTPPPFTSL